MSGEGTCVLGGAACGFLVWAYDYDFFLNAGGPETPISDAIRAYTHVQQSGIFMLTLEPLAVLMIVGALFGLGFSKIFLRTGRHR